jgi:predicted Rdx family selenoprotein
MSRKPHLIDLKELQDWMLKEEMLYATDGTKKLTINTAGSFTIRVKGEIVWQGIQPFSAVEKYNEL